MRGGPSQATIAAAGFVLALSLVATALAGSVHRQEPARGGGVKIHASGAMRIENSRAGAAILRAPSLAPGARVAGKVTIGNGGDAGYLTLSRQHLVVTPGAGGASLGDALRLTIRNVTAGAAPAPVVYSGPLAAMPSLQLGLLPPGAERRYRFAASLPEPGFVNLDLMGSRARFDYRWQLRPKR